MGDLKAWIAQNTCKGKHRETMKDLVVVTQGGIKSYNIARMMNFGNIIVLVPSYYNLYFISVLKDTHIYTSKSKMEYDHYNTVS